jgi:hypothetical protein
MLAHKVRGVAANLGLELLADALAQLEAWSTATAASCTPGAETELQERCWRSCDAAARRARWKRSAPRSPRRPPNGACGAPWSPTSIRAGAPASVLRDALRRGGLDDAAWPAWRPR